MYVLLAISFFIVSQSVYEIMRNIVLGSDIWDLVQEFDAV